MVVRTAQGDRYTRAEALVIDDKGRIVTIAGEPVLGKNGPLTVPTNDSEVSVAADGTVGTKRALIGQLRLVRFADLDRLESTGKSLLRTNQAPIDLTASQTRLLSGTLEKSNVQPVHEMSRLAKMTRSYEMVGRLLKSSQDSDDINKLANVPE